MDSHEAIELFDNIHGKVSHKALDLLENEWWKLSAIRKQNASCGCQLFTSCGLSCACRLAKVEATGGRIPLDAVDVFWRKLDLKPSFVENENVDVDKDVMPDGNCGFRSIAVGLGFDENKWLFIRQQLLQEMDGQEEWWRSVFDRISFQEYDKLRHTIDWQKVKAAPISHWMSMPYIGLIIAQRFGVIVQLLSIAGSQTFFPLWFGPNVHDCHQIVSFVHAKNAHFIHVKLDGDCPMPIPNALCILHRNDAAAEWENIYKDRIEWFKKIMTTVAHTVPQYVTNVG
ncbi:hypothetical protein L1987_24307 [Smallanthus sonchifolius]|uniref:Uncharacterized protein n=1 Tax=Smallanthus sonchifolius TaxID=185202 RepID=A0ACB9IJA4_9ASTR|nr:hypothetical protein L1987_24307 [Smallanthus sonchifolius]